MASIKDLFTFYLKAEDLRGRTVIATIESAKVEEVFNSRAKRNEPRLLVRFAGKKLALVCNKTQAVAIMGISGTEDYTKWTKTAVALSPGRSDNGKETIVISAPPANQTGTDIACNVSTPTEEQPPAAADAQPDATALFGSDDK
jgi:hypothetical protein